MSLSDDRKREIVSMNISRIAFMAMAVCQRQGTLGKEINTLTSEICEAARLIESIYIDKSS